MVLATLLFHIAPMRGVLRSSVSALIILLAALLLITSRGNYASYQIIFQSIRNIVPVITTAGLLTLHTRRKTAGSSAAQNEQIMLLVCVTAMCSLIQFPFAFPLYFCYVAPLAMLCAAALMSQLPTPPRLILYTAATVSILFGVFDLRPGFINRVGARYEQDEQTTRLSFASGRPSRVKSSGRIQRTYPFRSSACWWTANSCYLILRRITFSWFAGPGPLSSISFDANEYRELRGEIGPPS
jgi:hypothetical protein